MCMYFHYTNFLQCFQELITRECGLMSQEYSVTRIFWPKVQSVIETENVLLLLTGQ